MKTISASAAFLMGLFLAFYCCFPLQAQQHEQEMPAKFTDRIFFGGNMGLQFGDITLIDVSPMGGYRITSKVATGVSLTYKYYHINKYFYNRYTTSFENMTSNIYGGSIFARYYVVENLFAHAEYEYLLYAFDDYRPNAIGSNFEKYTRTVDVPGLFLGGGYRQPVGGRVYFSIMILYNIMESEFSPYSNPIIRAGVSVGL